MVNQSTSNRTLFHLRTVDEIRASFANRDEGACRNAWLYSYNPLTVKLVRKLLVAVLRLKAVAQREHRSWVDHGSR